MRVGLLTFEKKNILPVMNRHAIGKGIRGKLLMFSTFGTSAPGPWILDTIRQRKDVI